MDNIINLLKSPDIAVTIAYGKPCHKVITIKNNRRWLLSCII